MQEEERESQHFREVLNFRPEKTCMVLIKKELSLGAW
jgi:hypothetical protein